MLYLAIRFFFDQKFINLKYFFYVCSLCVIFVSLDVIYQFNFGQDIFGFKATTRRLGGPFGEELIAGSYIYRFSFFVIFSFFIFDRYKEMSTFTKFPLFSLISLIISLGLIFAGNRVPFVIFLFLTILCLLFYKKNRLYFLSLFFISISSLAILIMSNNETKRHYGGFVTISTNFFHTFSEDKIIKKEKDEKYSNDEINYSINFKGRNYLLSSTHAKEFYSGYKTWSKNKILGGGIKSFRYNCPTVFVNCNMHPHNYYLEILSDLGIVGFLMIVSFFIYLFYKSIKINNLFLLPFLLLLFGEIFPLKSTGSFFTTLNSAFIFLLISVIISSLVKKN